MFVEQKVAEFMKVQRGNSANVIVHRIDHAKRSVRVPVYPSPSRRSDDRGTSHLSDDVGLASNMQIQASIC